LGVLEIRIEACVNSVESAIEAEVGGAHRVELCDNLHDGGTTPSIGSIDAAHTQLDIDFNVMIRPRGGDFLYSDLELDIMRADVLAARAAGADGVVFGMLKADGTVNVEQSRQLVELAGPMSTTFHRAFDMCADPLAALEDLVSLGIDRVLTSGQRPSAIEGAALIKELVEAAHQRIIVMPGVGIDATNVAHLIGLTRRCLWGWTRSSRSSSARSATARRSGRSSRRRRGLVDLQSESASDEGTSLALRSGSSIAGSSGNMGRMIRR